MGLQSQVTLLVAVGASSSAATTLCEHCASWRQRSQQLANASRGKCTCVTCLNRTTKVAMRAFNKLHPLATVDFGQPDMFSSLLTFPARRAIFTVTSYVTSNHRDVNALELCRYRCIDCFCEHERCTVISYYCRMRRAQCHRSYRMLRLWNREKWTAM